MLSGSERRCKPCKAYGKKREVSNLAFPFHWKEDTCLHFSGTRKDKYANPLHDMSAPNGAFAAGSSGFDNKWLKHCQESRVSPFREKTGYLNSLTLQRHKLLEKIHVSWRDL